MEKVDFAEEISVHLSGKSALDYFKKLIETSGSPPELIFLDIRMPEMNGFEFLEEYKKLDTNFISATKVIILSSSLDINDQKKAREEPVIVRFLNKPLSKETRPEINYQKLWAG